MKKNKILINFLYWGEEKSGIYRYTYNLLKNLDKIAEDEMYVVTNSNLNLDYIKTIKFKTLKPKFLHFLNTQLILKKLIKDLKPDIIFNPFHLGYFLKINIPQISTIYDLIHLTTFKKRIFTFIYQKYFLKRLSDNSKIIITISNSSKKDLINFLKIDDKKIKVVYGCFDPIFKKLNFKKENFYLLVNPSFPYKNVEFVIKIWKKFEIQNTLLVVGYNKFYLKYFNYLKKLVKNLELEDKIKFLGNISDTELVELYNKAKALISSSLKEGFNLPPLEALACGTPVILSDIPVHREIYEDIGIFFDLNNEESFLKALDELKNLDYTEFEKKRVKFLKKFSWQKTSEDIYKIIKECMKG